MLISLSVLWWCENLLSMAWRVGLCIFQTPFLQSVDEWDGLIWLLIGNSPPFFSTLVLWYCGWISNMSKFQKTKNSILLFSGCVETSEAIVLIAPPPLVYNNFVIRWAFPTTLQDFFGQKKTFTENRKPLLFLCFKVKCLNQEHHFGPTASHICLQVLS
jgi:hypothetical protein